jgi:hypothetical protein
MTIEEQSGQIRKIVLECLAYLSTLGISFYFLTRFLKEFGILMGLVLMVILTTAAFPKIWRDFDKLAKMQNDNMN